ncbi:LysR family transcriptional regulator [Bordetella tumulicola]|uniref:LysR family transcriptional regulator n=1 Tax=Bordetella tumulicola TaxID=1649133 RepID=UPI0039F0D83B
MSNNPARWLKPSQLRLLSEIASHGQLQLAADAIAVTQPAASRMLAEVERQLGAALFVRRPKGMEPTSEGRAVLRRVEVVLREMRSMVADVDSLRQGLAGSVSVGAVTGPAVSLLMPAIREVKSIAPAAEISVDVMPSRDLLRHLMAGEMDFVLARILPEADAHDFEITPMSDEKIVIVARASHPLARAHVVTLTELSSYEWVMQQRGAPIREAIVNAFGQVGLSEPRNVVSSPSILLSMAYLAQGDAVTPMVTEVASLLTQPPIGAGFAVLNLPHDIRVSPYYLLRLRRRPLTPLALSLRDRLLTQSNRPDVARYYVSDE